MTKVSLEAAHEVCRLMLSGQIDQLMVDELLARARNVEAGCRQPALHELTLPEAVERLQKEMITAALERFGGNKSRAADLLGVSRRSFIRLVQGFGLGHVGRARAW